MPSRIFSLAITDEAWEQLHRLMGNWPKKSRNGVINHIINTYTTDRADEQYRLEYMEKELKIISEELRELKQQRR